MLSRNNPPYEYCDAMIDGRMKVAPAMSLRSQVIEGMAGLVGIGGTPKRARVSILLLEKDGGQSRLCIFAMT